ncbi:MAG: hypothetical protein GC153_02460 [Alphaproteobacteria bacterium]|nr:hypothetical protein [Alphaproteobacteria bacterium]
MVRHSAALLVLAAFAALPACEKKAPPAATAEPPPVTAQVTAADELGTFHSTINGIAFWTHPKVPFNGLALVATDRALVALNIEDGEEVARIDGLNAKGVSVAYTGYGSDAQGYAAVEIGGKQPSIRIYAIDNATRQLTPVMSNAIAMGPEARGFCLGGDGSGKGLLLHIMRGNGWSTRPIAISGGVATVGSQKSAAFGGGVISCEADDLDTSFFATAPGGVIVHVDKTGIAGGSPFARTPVSEPAGIGIALHGLVEGGPTEECCGEVLTLDGEKGAIYVYDHDDGKPLGVVTIKASFDVEGVTKATAIGVGSGNFGGVYRDGVVALGTDGDKPAVRLVPLNSVLDVLKAQFGDAADRRALNPHADEDADLGVNIPAPKKP